MTGAVPRFKNNYYLEGLAHIELDVPRRMLLTQMSEQVLQTLRTLPHITPQKKKKKR